MPSKNETEMFKEDFVPLIKQRNLFAKGFRDPFLDKRNHELLEQYAKAFTKKYKMLNVIIENDAYVIPKPTLLLGKEIDLQNAFFTIEKTIPDIKRVIFLNQGKYRSCSAQEFKLRLKEFEQHLNQGKVYIEYTFEKAQRVVKLAYREKHKAIQIFEDDFMIDEYDPEFKLCMHYAIEGGYDPDVDLSAIRQLFLGRASSEPESYKGPTAGRGTY